MMCPCIKRAEILKSFISDEVNLITVKVPGFTYKVTVFPFVVVNILEEIFLDCKYSAPFKLSPTSFSIPQWIPQQLFRFLPNDDVLYSFSLLPLLSEICKEELSFLLRLFIYPVICVYQHGLMVISFVVWVKTQCCHYLLYWSKWSSFGH